MPLIRIEQIEPYDEPSDTPKRFQARVSFEGQGEYPVTVTDPFSPEEEKRLEWYFEHYLRFPFTENVRFQEAARSVGEYGERLFQQVFGESEVNDAYRRSLNHGHDRLRFEIAGSHGFHTLHWEALKDPRLERAWSLQAPMVRNAPDSSYINAVPAPSPVVNLLIVTARPAGKADVGFRTISRPLVETLEGAEIPVRIHILRPGTYRALDAHLDEKGPGHYHVIHFDVHGSLMTYDDLEMAGFTEKPRYAREKFTEFEGLRAFLFLEREGLNGSDPVAAREVARIMEQYRIPVAILNACQSGKQVDNTEETSLGSRLIQAGAQMVVAMGYSVTVSAARVMMKQARRYPFPKPAYGFWGRDIDVLEIERRLLSGDVNLDDKRDSGEKTESILRCIEYSHSNLSQDAQELLSCLALFTGGSTQRPWDTTPKN